MTPFQADLKKRVINDELIGADRQMLRRIVRQLEYDLPPPKKDEVEDFLPGVYDVVHSVNTRLTRYMLGYETLYSLPEPTLHLEDMTIIIPANGQRMLQMAHAYLGCHPSAVTAYHPLPPPPPETPDIPRPEKGKGHVVSHFRQAEFALPAPGVYREQYKDMAYDMGMFFTNQTAGLGGDFWSKLPLPSPRIQPLRRRGADEDSLRSRWEDRAWRMQRGWGSEDEDEGRGAGRGGILRFEGAEAAGLSDEFVCSLSEEQVELKDRLLAMKRRMQAKAEEEKRKKGGGEKWGGLRDGVGVGGLDSAEELAQKIQENRKRATLTREMKITFLDRELVILRDFADNPLFLRRKALSALDKKALDLYGAQQQDHGIWSLPSRLPMDFYMLPGRAFEYVWTL
eukprot:gene34393-41626_t